MKDTLLLTFEDYREPAARLAEAADLPLAEVEVHRFPDNEVRVRLPVPVSGSLPERVILVRSLDHPNEKLIELLLSAETARTLGARHLTLVAPYLCYMRQDVAFHPGEAVSQRIIGRFLGEHFDHVITVDPHLHRTHDLQEVFPGARTTVLSATESIARFLRGRFEAPVLVGPDAESRQWVGRIAEREGLEFVVGTKVRLGDAEVQVAFPGRDFTARDVVLVDDVASTGRSLVAAAATIAHSRPRSLTAIVTHGLFERDALAALASAGVTTIWSTDSIRSHTNVVHLAPLLLEALERPPIA